MTRRVCAISLAVSCLLVVSACGKDAEEGFKTVSSSPKRSAQVACNVEYGVVDTAREAYITLNGEPPKQTSDLLQVIKDLPTYIEVETDGSLGLTARAEELGCELPRTTGTADTGAGTNSTDTTQATPPG